MGRGPTLHMGPRRALPISRRRPVLGARGASLAPKAAAWLSNNYIGRVPRGTCVEVASLNTHSPFFYASRSRDYRNMTRILPMFAERAVANLPCLAATEAQKWL